MKTNTRKSKLVRSLQNGSEFTAGQIAARFGLANPTATINTLRQEGYAIYANKRTNSRGEVYTKYKLGKPTRRMVATGYRLWGAFDGGLTK